MYFIKISKINLLFQYNNLKIYFIILVFWILILFFFVIWF
jgi:hypothetical protein